MVSILLEIIVTLSEWSKIRHFIVSNFVLIVELETLVEGWFEKKYYGCVGYSDELNCYVLAYQVYSECLIYVNISLVAMILF